MTTLTAVLDHRPAEQADAGMALLREVDPDARVVLCHAGREEDFARLREPEAVYLDDPSLRGPPRGFQSYHQLFERLLAGHVAPDPSITALYVIEYDHLVLRGAHAEPLEALAERTRAAFMGKNAIDRTGVNWWHAARFRRDEALLAHLRRLSVREDPTRLFGCLGDGFWLSREALEAYVAVGRHPPAYGELYVPTLLHHLGFRVVDVDAHSELYRHVRWGPDHDVQQVLDLAAAGVTFVHPVKAPGAAAALGGRLV